MNIQRRWLWNPNLYQYWNHLKKNMWLLWRSCSLVSWSFNLCFLRSPFTLFNSATEKCSLLWSKDFESCSYHESFISWVYVCVHRMYRVGICAHTCKIFIFLSLELYIFSYIWGIMILETKEGEENPNQMSNEQTESGFLSLSSLHFFISWPKGSSDLGPWTKSVTVATLEFHEICLWKIQLPVLQWSSPVAFPIPKL